MRKKKSSFLLQEPWVTGMIFCSSLQTLQGPRWMNQSWMNLPFHQSQPKFLGQDMTELWNFRCNFNIRSAYHQGFLHETATSYLASGDSGTPWSTGRGSSCITMNSSPALEGWSWSSATSTSIPSQNDSSRLALHCISNLTIYKVPWMLESTGM